VTQSKSRMQLEAEITIKSSNEYNDKTE